MENNSRLIKELSEKEIKAGLYDVTIGDIPLWRLVRFKYRITYLNKKTGFTNKSTGFELSKVELVKYFFISFFQFLILFFRKNKVENVVFAFPRLYNVGGVYIDKFTDPVIEDSALKESCLIFQHSFGQPHLNPRKNKDRLIYADFIDVLSKVLSKVLKFIFFKKYKSEIEDLTLKAQSVFPETEINKLFISETLAAFMIYSFFYQRIFHFIMPKNLFVVNREVFKFALYLGHKNNCKIFEFQHGITQSETVLYSGLYDEGYDPDYFLVFGKAWKNDFYGIPKQKIHNVGWAYSKYIRSSIELKSEINKKAFLVISSPAITQNIIEFVVEARKEFPDYFFNIRLHPQEKLSSEQNQTLLNCQGVAVIDNSKDSFFSVLAHDYILGDNSTVLYEALSMGKKVGKINSHNMYSRNLNEDIKNGFFVIEYFSDLKTMVLSEESRVNNYYYSTFKKELFNKLIT